MILITGGMGFLGMHIARQLAATDRLLLTYHRSRRDAAEVEQFVGAPAAIERLDVGSPYSTAEVFRKHKVDSVVHLAVPGLGALAPSEEIAANVAGLTNILEASRLAGVRRVTLASSVTVYHGIPTGPYVEDVPLPVRSASATGAMKKALEVFALHYADRTGLDIVLLRIAAIYGPLYHTIANLPSRLVHHAVKGRPLDGIENAWSLAQLAAGFDLCYATDCARAVAIVHNAKTPQHRIYNVGGGSVVHADDVLDAVNAWAPTVTLPAQLLDIEDKHDDKYMDITRLADEFSFTPQFNLKEGIRDYADWLQGHAV